MGFSRGDLSCRIVGAARSGRLVGQALALCALVSAMAHAPSAGANVGYEPDHAQPTIALGGELAHGIAVDQSSQKIYVAIATTTPLDPNVQSLQPGLIEQFESNGQPTSSSPFAFGSETYPASVAVNPVTHGIYVNTFAAAAPFGTTGSPNMLQLSSSGVAGSQFALVNPAGKAPQIATSAAGNVYYPSSSADAVQVFDSTGTLVTTITCSSCPGGNFTSPVAVALNSAGAVYVVDAGTQRVVKFTGSPGSYVFDSTLQSGLEPGAVAVDPSNDSVYVGGLQASGGYHVVAYNSSGVQFDDFGSGAFGALPFGGVDAAGQIAVDGTSHKLYAVDPGNKVVRVFERTTIAVPSSTAVAPTAVGQLSATLKANVNANSHAVLTCEFEYTDAADFNANGYANATHKPCSSLPKGSASTAVSAGVSGLEPGVTYHYRVTAASNAGSTSGSEVTFATLPAVPPTITAESASGLSVTSATIAGSVNPHGGAVSDCHFEYGTSTAYGEVSPCPTAVGMTTTSVVEKRKITGLVSATSYHYRLVVTSNAGTSKGEDREFTTLSPPTETTEPVGGGGGVLPVVPPAPPPITSRRKPLKCKKGFEKKKKHGKLRCVKKKPKRRS